MVTIKSNQLLNQYSPLDLAEIKSQPLKLTKITAVVAVQGSSLQFPSPGGYLHLSLPIISTTQPPSPSPGGYLHLSLPIISTTTQPPSVRHRFS
ncbi:hypothetical protein Hanom_Chr17g01541771 [Helianthus anomalus]